MGNFIIPPWLKIVGPLVALLLIFAGVKIYGHSRYSAGHEAGVVETDAKWQKASDELKAEARKSATRADDAAVKRLEEHVAQAQEDQEKIDAANENGTSPLDAIFGN
jgi:uncharacterized membrane protein (DUF106 family)